MKLGFALLESLRALYLSDNDFDYLSNDIEKLENLEKRLIDLEAKNKTAIVLK